ncbi:MAG: cupredoxin domain-containing protein [Candidatus Thermoplasmatota archaeon]|jgi:plastocyanin
MALRPLASLLLLSTLALAGCSGDDTEPGSGLVEIHDFKFEPATLTVRTGDVIHFTNHDSAAHTATANAGAFDTASISGGDSAEVVLSTPGTFAYHCKFHASMTGAITVTA